MEALKQSTAALTASAKHPAPACLNVSRFGAAVSAVPRAALALYATVILGMVEIVGYVRVSSLSYGKLLALAKETTANLSLQLPLDFLREAQRNHLVMSC